MTLCHILPERRGWVNMIIGQAGLSRLSKATSLGEGKTEFKSGAGDPYTVQSRDQRWSGDSSGDTNSYRKKE